VVCRLQSKHFRTSHADPLSVYHWATITAGKHGRPCGFFAGWWNFLAWIFGASSITAILGNQVVAMYAAFRPDFQAHAWHVFVAYLLCGWICCATVLFANRALPKIEILGGFLIIAGVLITIIVCAVMPSINGTGHASNSFVWHDWSNQTGYTSNGFVFVAGMLNGAYAVGTPDAVTHLAEEIPHPSKNVPKAILAQMIVGFWTGFLYLIAIFYAVNDLTAVLTSSSTFPIAEIYRQATGSASGSVGLLILAFLPTFGTAIGCYITASRTFWTLSRDNATPAAKFFSRVHPTFKNPFNAIALCGAICTVMGCIYVGSTTAFNAFVGSYVILSTLSYLAAILPHLLSRRANIAPGWFWMKGPVGYIVNATSVLYIMAFIVIFCFPFALPVTAKTMNYASLITGGLTVFVAGFWLVRRGSYVGPRVVAVGEGGLASGAI
jgi:choline transport protein